MNETNANQQIETMQKLSQAAAAWLIGVSARSLRDEATCPRNACGSYDAAKVAAWAASRCPRPKLDDDDAEKLSLIVEHAFNGEHYAAGLLRLVGELREKYGEAAVAVELLDRMTAEWRTWLELERDEQTPERRRLREQQAQEREREEQAESDLRISVVCGCGRVRKGTTWPKGKPPAGFATIEGVCPLCAGA